MADAGDDGAPSDGDVEGVEPRYRYLVEHIQDAVVEFEFQDGEPLVRSANPAFVDTFGYERDLHGASLNDLIVPAWCVKEARSLDQRTAAGEVNYRRVKRETTSGLREFLYRGVPLSSAATRADGIAVYTDLTDIVRHERRLAVMNRVLRHDLRNAVNVIAGHAASLRDGVDDPDAHAEAVESVTAAAQRLETLADEASAIERALTTSVEDPTVDCVPVLRDIVADARRQFSDASFRTDLPDTLSVRATDHVGVAVESLVDNAVRHNPTSSPVVRLRATAADLDGWANVFVEDNGPPIPVDERQVVLGDAEITPVQHGSGLGLWVVKWVTESFGGEVSFEESSLGGNAVRLRLPRPQSDCPSDSSNA